MNNDISDKTVYVLGAGFSAAAGFPMQGKILEYLLEPSTYAEGGLFEADIPSDTKKQIDVVADFLDTAFPDTDGRQMEDIFTLLDQLIDIRGSFAKYPLDELLNIRSAWIRLIVTLFFKFSLIVSDDQLELYQRFVARLLYDRIKGDHPHESTSVVSLNWDGLFEDAFTRLATEVGAERKAGIDYCVYTVPLKKDAGHHTPSTLQKAKGMCNFKLLKLHGSATWFRCPASNRVYTSAGLSPIEGLKACLETLKSPLTEEYPDSREEETQPLLEPFIITPTFEKVFDLPHIQTVWQNAYLELRQASKVVFIGYSLPEADYHFKTLIRRAIRPEAEIRAILCDRDRPVREGGTSGGVPLEHSVEARFIRLFGKLRVQRETSDEYSFVPTVSYSGFESFVEALSPVCKFPELKETLKGLLKNYEDPS